MSFKDFSNKAPKNDTSSNAKPAVSAKEANESSSSKESTSSNSGCGCNNNKK